MSDKNRMPKKTNLTLFFGGLLIFLVSLIIVFISLVDIVLHESLPSVYMLLISIIGVVLGISLIRSYFRLKQNRKADEVGPFIFKQVEKILEHMP